MRFTVMSYQRVFLLLILWQVVFASLSFGNPIGNDLSIKLSSSGRYLVDQNAHPFFMNGDTAWSLIVQLSKTDAEIYLTDRAQKGFNVVLVNLIESAFSVNAPANYYGNPPFETFGDFDTPNEAYFAHADWVINKAAEKGIVVLLAPLYLGWACGSEGWCEQVKNSSLATMRDYGYWLGNRYRTFNNIIWLIGGDTDPVANGIASKVRQFVAGIQEADGTHLFSAHNGPEQSAMDVWPSEPWLNLNNVYTYGNAYPPALAQFNRLGAKPFFLIETFYENEHASTPLSLRRQAYWTVLSGGIGGHIFGNCPIWNFNAPSASKFCAGGAWETSLSSSGSETLAHVGQLFSSRAFSKLVPDQDHSVLTVGYDSGTLVGQLLRQLRMVLTGGYESGVSYAAAARASDGSSIVAYIPTKRTVTINLTKVAGPSANAWWFNPRTGGATLIDTYPTSGETDFDPPDDNDWVLVVDNASLELPPPGTATLSFAH